MRVCANLAKLHVSRKAKRTCHHNEKPTVSLPFTPFCQRAVFCSYNGIRIEGKQGEGIVIMSPGPAPQQQQQQQDNNKHDKIPSVAFVVAFFPSVRDDCCRSF